MLLHTKGQTHNFQEPLVGRVTRDPNRVENSFLILEDGFQPISNSACIGLITNQKLVQRVGELPIMYGVPSLDHLAEGDIVSIDEDGNLNTIYRVNSFHNTLLATERCNSNCLMCSQPPKDRNDIQYSYAIHCKLIPLIPKDCPELGISGGEPTLMGDYFYDLIKLAKRELPNTEIHILTNGRSFAWPQVAEKLQVCFVALDSGLRRAGKEVSRGQGHRDCLGDARQVIAQAGKRHRSIEWERTGLGRN